MLSRTAACLYWMARYMERAENIARILEVTGQMGLLPGSSDTELAVPLAITRMREGFDALGQPLQPDMVLNFLALDPGNPSSIYSCFQAARENARVARGKITSEMSENLNSTWLEMRMVTQENLGGTGAARFLEWVKERSHLYRGVTYGTMVRGDAFHFSRLGTFLERADNTARTLDIKYHQILPDGKLTGSLDYYQGAALLRSVGALEAYSEIYRDTMTPERIVELLVLRPDVPRSLRSCLDALSDVIRGIEGSAGRHAKRLVAELTAQLSYDQVEEILDSGLQTYLERFVTDLNRLGQLIHTAYLEVA